MKLPLYIITCLLLSSCASNTGEVSIFSVNSSKKLDSPLVAASQLYNADSIIYKTNEAHALNGDDTFSIYLTDSYLRYLPDIGGVNEVIIVVEFEEVLTGTDSDTVTKILGPYDSVSDATKTPFFHKALYGPKRMESDILSMSLKIYEYDLEENGKVGSLIDFIATAGEALSLSNPVTSQEIKVAKELAKSITNTNDNDLVFQLDLDFVAGNNLYNHPGNAHLNVLPLKAGELVLIKQESCGIGQCYNYFSQEESFKNPVGYLVDALLLPVTAIVTGVTDSPASSSLTDVESKKFTVQDSGLAYADDQEKPNEYDLFRDKTWLRLSILKGGDPSLWDKRKLLYPIQENLSKLLKTSNGIASTNLEEPIAALNAAKKHLNVLRVGGIKLVSKNSDSEIQYIPTGETSASLCLAVPDRFTLIPTSPLYESIKPVAIASPTNHQCYTLVPPPPVPAPVAPAVASFTKGKGYFQVNYKENGELKSHIVAVKVLDPLTSTNTSACKLPSGEFRLKTTLNSTAGILGIDTLGVASTPNIDKKTLTHLVNTLNDKPSIKTVFGKTNIDLSAINKPVSNCI